MSRSTRILGLVVALLAQGGAVLGAAPAQAAAGCQVTYTKTNEWTTSPGQGGFGANLTVQNLGDPLARVCGTDREQQGRGLPATTCIHSGARQQDHAPPDKIEQD